MIGRKKRGQVTVFIIVGIILLFSTALIVYIRSRAVEEIPAAQVPAAISEVPAELQPLRDYVESCLRQTATDALTAIGAHGGYLGTTLDQALEYSLPTFTFTSLGLNPTEDDGITVSPDWQVPYWFFMKSQNTCQADCEFSTSLIPPLEGRQGVSTVSIERQMNQYIAKQVIACLNDFAPFRAQGFAITPTATAAASAASATPPVPVVPAVATVFGDKDVAVYLEYPLHVRKEEAASDMKQFLVRLDVPFRRIYELAYGVAQQEASLRFLDVHALTLIAAYSGFGAGRLPPMAGTELSYVPNYWLKSEVQKQLQDILTAQTSSVRVANTRNYRFYDFGDDLLKTTLYRKKIVPFDKTHPDLDVEFEYLDWPLYFYIMPGEMIKPRESFIGQIFAAIIPLQRYDLPYDVSYPVRVHVHDDYAFGGKGYDFFFGLEANVRNNAVLGDTSVVLPGPDAGGDDSGQLCDPRQRDSNEYTFAVQDPLGKPIDNVIVSFVSSDQFCVIGKTQLDAHATEARFTGRFPTGAVGVLMVQKPGYTTYVENYFIPAPRTTPRKEGEAQEGEEQEGEEQDGEEQDGEKQKEYKEQIDLNSITLKPTIDVRVVGSKVNIDYLTVDFSGEETPVKDWVLRPTDQPLLPNERLTIIMERQKENPFENDFIAYVDITGMDAEKKMALLPGTYKMTVLLLREGETIIIPQRRKCYDDDRCVTLPQVRLDSGSRSDVLGIVSQQSIPDELQKDVAAAGNLPKPPAGVPDLAADTTRSTIFLEGQHVLENVVITDEIYTASFPLKLTGISFNIAGIPESERRHEHLETMAKLQEYVNNNPALFTPYFGIVDTLQGGGAAG